MKHIKIFLRGLWTMRWLLIGIAAVAVIVSIWGSFGLAIVSSAALIVWLIVGIYWLGEME